MINITIFIIGWVILGWYFYIRFCSRREFKDAIVILQKVIAEEHEIKDVCDKLTLKECHKLLLFVSAFNYKKFKTVLYLKERKEVREGV